MTNSIEVINLSKKYKDKEAVANINFKINENEMVGLLGPNGCGKTTTTVSYTHLRAHET